MAPKARSAPYGALLGPDDGEDGVPSPAARTVAGTEGQPFSQLIIGRSFAPVFSIGFSASSSR